MNEGGTNVRCAVIIGATHQNPLSATEQFPQSVMMATFTLQSCVGSMTECGIPPSVGTILGQQKSGL